MNFVYNDICIAGANIRIQSDNAKNILLEKSYIGFIANNVAHYDVLITTIGGIPKDLTDESQLLFEGCDKKVNYFSIFKHTNGYRFVVYDQSQENRIQQVALLNTDLSEWTIYFENSNPTIDNYPLAYPMGALIFYYLSVKMNAIMIHASGVFDGEIGRLFTGVSGVGKSTMANIWKETGSVIVNDDRLIIRKEGNHFFMYNTPMCSVDIYKRAKLNHIYTLKHAPINTSVPLLGVKAVSRVMAFCIQHSYNQHLIEHQLAFVSDFCSAISVVEIGFVPNTSIINFIKSDEGRSTL